jgi:hypothetical protein
VDQYHQISPQELRNPRNGRPPWPTSPQRIAIHTSSSTPIPPSSIPRFGMFISLCARLNILMLIVVCSGDWAGAVWSSTGVPGQSVSCAQETGFSTCSAFVQASGASFSEACKFDRALTCRNIAHHSYRLGSIQRPCIPKHIMKYSRILTKLEETRYPDLSLYLLESLLYCSYIIWDIEGCALVVFYCILCDFGVGWACMSVIVSLQIAMVVSMSLS